MMARTWQEVRADAVATGRLDEDRVADAKHDLVERERAIERLRYLARKPGVLHADLYDDGVELVGSPNDGDDFAGFLGGTFEYDDIVAALHPLPVNDETSTK